MAAAERFPLIFTQERVLPVATLFSLAGALVFSSALARTGCLLLAALTVALALLQRARRPAVVVDDDGYAVEERGREKLRVAWSAVVRVRADAAERALYIDCGDPAKNLLVPPRRGYAFRFAGAERLYQRVIAAVPGRVELVDRLERAPAEQTDTKTAEQTDTSEKR